jgi:hypothetical protein
MRFDTPVVLSIDCNLLRCDTIKFGRWVTMFWRAVVCIISANEQYSEGKLQLRYKDG